MFEEDYIMRVIKEMVRAILKFLFNIDAESATGELLEDEQEQNILNELIDMIDKGKINEAENKLYPIVESGNLNDLKIAVLFYSYLNEKDDDFLQDNCFARDEVKTGLQDVVSKYGLSSLVDVF